jgi:uncharacterized membrane protein/protein-disulfide isomerase
MSKTIERIIIVAAVVGLLASGAASYVHYRILQDPTYTSFCDVDATFSCSQAYTSRFGSFRGMPVAVLGTLWFVFAALLAAAGRMARPAVRENVPGYLFAASTLALAVVLYLGYASFVILQTVCVLCVMTYVAVLAIFLASGAATTFPMTSLPRRALHDLKVLATNPAAIVLTLLFLGGAAYAVAFFPREVPATTAAGNALPPVVSPGQQTELERFMATATRVPLEIPTEGAKVLVVKFNDYQCPACSQSHMAYKPILAKYQAEQPGAVRVVLRDFPLNPDCNSSVTRQLHAAACDAAVAVRLAREHGRGEQMEEWLYTHQQGMTTQTVRQAAREIGQVPDFDARYAATLELVKADIELGKRLKIGQTPTFFINGVQIDGAWASQFFDQAIAYELQRAK